MRRLTFNLILDLVAFAGFVFLTATGVIVRYVLPPGSGRFRSVWGLDRHEWGDIHFWIAIGFLGALVLHMFVHWRWILSVVHRRRREGSWARIAIGLVGLVALLALAFAPLLSPVETVGTRVTGRGHSSARNDMHELIRGSMSLRDVEQATGVPAEHIVRELGLPLGVPTEEHLGRLRRAYSFELEDVRRIVRRYRR